MACDDKVDNYGNWHCVTGIHRVNQTIYGSSTTLFCCKVFHYSISVSIIVLNITLILTIGILYFLGIK